MKEKKCDIAPNEEPYERTGGIQGIMIDLANGRRKPVNDKERELLKQIKDIEARGNMLDLPFE